MKKISRRNLLMGSAALGAGSALYSPLGKAAVFVPTKRSSKKAVVIGSGFGGSVASLRLTQAGIDTALVERGKHWEYKGENSFPLLGSTGLNNLKGNILWREPGVFGGSTGMLEQHFGGGIPVGVGACLGGGSLVYGGVLLQPRREVFEQSLPNISYDDMDKKYYPKVLSKVSGGPIPDDILNSPNYQSKRMFMENATAAGLEVVRSEVGFNWNIIREEIEGKRKAFASVGEWIFGCNSGAKNSLDRNYIAEARATGKLEVNTLHNVKHIRKKPFSRSYEVYCEVIGDEGRVVSNHIIECQYLFMAAGSIHTTRLLLKAKAQGDIDLNDGIGQEWGTNGDQLKARNDINTSTGPIQGGPPSIAAFDLQNPIKPTGFMHAPSPTNGEFVQLQMGMCIPDKNSTATYTAATDDINFNWSNQDNANITKALNLTMNKMIEHSGGTLGEGVSAMGTWHPVGGAAMGTACSELGEVLGSPNLFVVDGALIPGSTGAANPSLTIGANAERVMEGLIPKLS